MKYLFFDLATTGHHVEFLYHIISYRLQHPELGEFIFVTHPDFIECVNQLDSGLNFNAHGVMVVHPTDSTIQRLSQMQPGIRRSNAEFDVFCEFAKKHQPQCAYIMYLNRYQYALGCPKARRLNCNIRAILFNPLGPITGKRKNWFTALRKRMQIKWMLRNPNLKQIYILNDEHRAALLNDCFGVQQLFVSIPDPVLILPITSYRENQTSCRLEPGRHRFLLFGSLSSRKGIFVVLEAMRRLPEQVAIQIELFLAGKVVEHQKKEFAAALAALCKDCPHLQVTHLDAFIPYNQIPSLFTSATAILAPYVGNESSSGLLGHAALYKKTVIGPDQGLIGKLIHQYDLGLTIKNIDAEKLANVITILCQQEKAAASPDGLQRYIRERHPNVFVESLLSL